MTRMIRTATGLVVAAATLLAACGGGGGDSGGTATAATSDADAVSIAANATSISDSAATAADAAILAAQSVVTAPPIINTATGALAHARSQEAQASPNALTNVTVTCLGGGAAKLNLSGGTSNSLTNGKLDAGEIYQIAFDGCRSALGAVAVDGSLTLTVNAADANGWSLTLVADALSATLAGGSVSLTGSLTREASVATTTDGSTQLTGKMTSPGLTLATSFRNRSSTFALAALDITRQSTWKNGLFQSSTLNGTHTLAINTPNLVATYTVATQGGVSYSVNGVPQAGAWTITLPGRSIGVSVASSTATITIDDGKDGSVDRTISVPVARLQSDAG